MNYITVKEYCKKYKVKETIVTYNCRMGNFQHCMKEGKYWLIGEDEQIPLTYNKTKIDNNAVLPLPIGVSKYSEMVEKYFYVDKTLMIKDIIDTLPKVSLFTRPRRFGKTINMDMLKTYFEKTNEDTSIYFKDKLIWQCEKKYQSYQGKYPVIYLSFKDIKCNNYDEAINKIKYLIKDEYYRHSFLCESLKGSELAYFNKVLTLDLNDMELSLSLSYLSKFLADSNKEKTIIIIDEYDTAIQEGYLKGYYEDIVLFMRNLLSGAFKDNSYLEMGFLSGILKIAKESVFSGLNNLRENSILNDIYSEYFGFTKEDVKQILKYYGFEDKYAEACSWYNGYLFGNHEIFNPWSILNYVDNKCKPYPYWQSTGSNDIIKQIVNHNSSYLKNMLESLLDDKSLYVDINSSVVYPELNNNPENVFSFLLLAGYLKVVRNNNKETANNYEVKIPNKEIFSIYAQEILSSLNNYEMKSSALKIRNAILNQNNELFKKELKNYLLQSVSYFDTNKEDFFQGLMLGIYAVMNDLYVVSSNKEAGDGRYDLELTPIDLSKNKTGIIIELKVLTKDKFNDEQIQNELVKSAKKAIEQIDKKHYKEELASNGVKHLVKYGMAFYKKNVEIMMAEESI